MFTVCYYRVAAVLLPRLSDFYRYVFLTSPVSAVLPCCCCVTAASQRLLSCCEEEEEKLTVSVSAMLRVLRCCLVFMLASRSCVYVSFSMIRKEGTVISQQLQCSVRLHVTVTSGERLQCETQQINLLQEHDHSGQTFTRPSGVYPSKIKSPGEYFSRIWRVATVSLQPCILLNEPK